MTKIANVKKGAGGTDWINFSKVGGSEKLQEEVDKDHIWITGNLFNSLGARTTELETLRVGHFFKKQVFFKYVIHIPPNSPI